MTIEVFIIIGSFINNRIPFNKDYFYEVIIILYIIAVPFNRILDRNYISNVIIKISN